MMFPGLLMTLLDKCGISPDKRVTAHPFFGPSAQTRFEDTLSFVTERGRESVCVCTCVCVCVCVLSCVCYVRVYMCIQTFLLLFIVAPLLWVQLCDGNT